MDTTTGNGNWYSIVESLDRLSISRGTLYDRIKKEELTTKKDGRNRFVWIDDEILNQSTQNKKSTTDMTDMKNQLDYFMNRVDKLEDELLEQRKRHDTIVLEMTRQNQLLLQSGENKKPFWSRWFV